MQVAPFQRSRTLSADSPSGKELATPDRKIGKSVVEKGRMTDSRGTAAPPRREVLGLDTYRRRRDPKDDDRHFSRLDAQRGWLSITLQSVRTDIRQFCNLLWMLSAWASGSPLGLDTQQDFEPFGLAEARD